MRWYAPFPGSVPPRLLVDFFRRSEVFTVPPFVPMILWVSIIVGKIWNEVMALGSPVFGSEGLTTAERTIFGILYICKE